MFYFSTEGYLSSEVYDTFEEAQELAITYAQKLRKEGVYKTVTVYEITSPVEEDRAVFKIINTVQALYYIKV